MDPGGQDVEGIVGRLLSSAGITSAVASLKTALGTNANVVIVLASGERLVCRRYVWHGEAADRPLARMRRERFVYEQLGTPQVFGELEYPPALLLEFIPGPTLGDLAAQDGATVKHWSDAGRSLRAVHDLPVEGFARAGVQIDAADPARDLEAAASLFMALAESRPELDLTRAWEIHSEAESSDERRYGLVHGDAHLWNVLAGPRSVVIDLEKSRLGDPDYDLAYMEAFRFADVGALPDAFFDGYGGRPSGPWWDLHSTYMFCLILDAAARGHRSVEPGLRMAEDRLRVLGVKGPT